MNEELRTKTLRVPSCAKMLDVKFSPKHGFVAATFAANGYYVTFLRTEFLNEPFKPVAWDYAEKFIPGWYTEVIPEQVEKSIKECGGIYVSRDFVQTIPGENKQVPSGGETVRGMSYCHAEMYVKMAEIPEMEPLMLPGAVYDLIGRWLIETGSLSAEEWTNSPSSVEEQNRILDRDCGGWTIRELMGDIFQLEWTSESYDQMMAVARSGIPRTDGERDYPSRKRYAWERGMFHDKAVVRRLWCFE